MGWKVAELAFSVIPMASAKLPTVADLIKEDYPDLTDEEIEEWQQES